MHGRDRGKITAYMGQSVFASCGRTDYHFMLTIIGIE